MGVGFWGSLVFFSQASNVIGGDLAPTIAWPLFMVFIILTSNFWSWKSDEWKNAGTKASRRMIFSLALFVVAIIVFSISSTFEPGHDIECHHIKHRNYPTCEHKSE